MLGLLNTVLSKGNTLLTYVKDGLVMANRFLTPPKLTFPVDASAEFNGTSDYIQTNEPLIKGAHTICVWINSNNDADYRQIVDSRDAGSDGTYFLINPSEQIMHRVYGYTLTSSAITAEEWHFVTATFDGTTQKIYLNGSLDASQSASATYDVVTPTTIGSRSYGSSEYFGGNLANVAIWNRALSSDEINSVMWKSYEQVSATESNGLQAWYKLSASEALSGDSTATLTEYASVNKLTFEAPACVQTALNAFPDITDGRLYSANYDIRVSADGGNVESLNCVETELNALLV